MKPCAFTYHTPGTVSEAVTLLASKDNARVLAGGQSLVPMMNFRYVLPDALIDINRIAALNGIAVKGDRIEIGAATRQRTLEYSTDIGDHCPLLAEAIPHIGHRQTRNRGTIGGSLAHADPAAELPLIALALDAGIQADSARGRRTIPIAEFLRGYLTTTLAQDELLVRVDIPVWPRGHGFAFVEFARRRGDFALAAAAALILLDGNGKVVRVSLALGGIGQKAVRVPEAEEILLGESATPPRIAEAASAAERIEAGSDIHANAEYRAHLAHVLSAKALALAAERAKGGAHG